MHLGPRTNRDYGNYSTRILGTRVAFGRINLNKPTESVAQCLGEFRKCVDEEIDLRLLVRE